MLHYHIPYIGEKEEENYEYEMKELRKFKDT
jgi:hypothetical protein